MKKSLRWKHTLALLLMLTMLFQTLALTGFAVETGTTGTGEAAAPAYPYLDTDLSFEERAADLVSRMTLEEKASQLRAQIAPAIPRLGVAQYNWWNEALHGIAQAGTATSYTTGLGIASTWNTELVEEMMSAASGEAREKYNVNRASENWRGLSYWSPTINLARDPRWGRADESYGEDPYLAAQLGNAFINGFQGNGEDDRYLKAICTSKHFIANNSEYNRHNGTSNFDDRTLREYYTYAFKSTVQNAKVQSIMTAYNAVNGVPVSVDTYLLDDLLRRTWGFDGYVVTDCDTLTDVVGSHGWRPNDAEHPWEDPAAWTTYPAWGGKEATAFAMKAGTDLNCGGTMPDNAKAAIEAGLMTEDDLDVALVRLFTARMMTGEFDPVEMVKYAQDGYLAGDQVHSEAHRQLAEDSSDEAVVLLQNNPAGNSQQPFLPLDGKSINKLVVIGPLADEMQLGNYTTQNPKNTSTPLEGITAALQRQNPAAAVEYIDGTVSGGTGYLMNMGDLTILGDDGQALGTIDLDKNVELSRKGQFAISGGATSYGEDGCWLKFKNIDFTGAKNIRVSMAGPNSARKTRVTIYGGSLPEEGGKPLGRMEEAAYDTGSWGSYQDYTFPFTGAGGGYDREWDTVYLVMEAATDESGFTTAQANSIREADAVVAYAGTILWDSYEEHDRGSLALPRSQADMINNAAALNPKTVAYIQAVGQVDVESFKENVPSILWTCYNGQAQGNAAGRLLFGESNPSGRLPFTWYTDISQLDATGSYAIRPSDANAPTNSRGRTYQYFTGDVTYPFGYGLSYSDFTYENLSVSKNGGAPESDLIVTPNDTLNVRFDVSNTSGAAGAEVAEIYVVSPTPDQVERPAKRLKAFDKQTVSAGETAHFSMDIPVSDLYFWDQDNMVQTFDQGAYTIQVGSNSSTASLTQTFTLSGELDVKLANVTAIPSGHVLTMGEPRKTITTDLSAAHNDETFVNLETAAVTYVSSRPGVACVDQNGVVTAVGGGVTTITATVEENGVTMRDSYPVVVQETVAATEITVDGTPLFGFAPDQLDYSVDVDSLREPLPAVAAKAAEGAAVSVEQATVANPIATVTISKNGEQAVYHISFAVPLSGMDFTKATEDELLRVWKITNENAAKWGLTEDGLTISMEPGDVFNANKSAKNVFWQSASGDWNVEVALECSQELNTGYEQACVMAFQDLDNYAKVGCEAQGAGNRHMMFNVEANAKMSQTANVSGINGTKLWFRLQKAGDHYSAWYSLDGSEFHFLKTNQMTFEDVKLGLLAYTGNPNVGPDITYKYVKRLQNLKVVNGTGSGIYAEGDQVTITAAGAPEGKRFTGWTAVGVELEDGNAQTLTFTMPSNDVSLTANFEAIPPYSIEIKADKPSVQAGEDVTVTVTAKGGAFVGAACKLSYDSGKFEVKSAPEGWDNLETDSYGYYNVIDSGFYEEDTVLGAFLFTAREQEKEGTGTFHLTENYIVAEWEEGWSKDDAVKLPDSSVDVKITLAPTYVVEIVNDYVAGHSLVLVYTNNEAGAYAYDGRPMYNVTSAGYQYHDTAYTHVYGLVAEDASADKVAAIVGESAGSLIYSPDVNDSGKVDLNDAVAVVAAYNANELYMDAIYMNVLLKADVNRDKKVNVDDFGLIKADYMSKV